MKKIWICAMSLAFLVGGCTKKNEESEQSAQHDSLTTTFVAKDSVVEVKDTMTIKKDTIAVKKDTVAKVTTRENVTTLKGATTKKKTTSKTNTTTKPKTSGGKIHSTASHLYDTHKPPTGGNSTPPLKDGATTNPKTSGGKVHSTASHLYDTQKPPTGGNSIPPTKTPTPQPEVYRKKADLSHTNWQRLMKQYVANSGKVNYKGIKSDRSELDEYLSILAQNPPQADWESDKKLAYWLNLYNAATVKLILNNYPVASIKDISEKPWDKAFIKVGSETYSLNQIENEIIRKEFNDPRVHFALNCSANSCPKLMNDAFSPEKLDFQLDKLTREFLSNGAANDISEKKLQLSNIFSWYAKDFSAEGGVIPFIRKYTGINVKDNAAISYLPYDWKLNE